jgi:hypothetical protein
LQVIAQQSKGGVRTFQGTLDDRDEALVHLAVGIDRVNDHQLGLFPEGCIDNLHLLIEDKGKKVSAVMVEGLTTLQKKILSILKLPEEIYDLSFKHGKKNSAF